MPTFWSMPCKRGECERYRHGWMMATAERWQVMKEVRGAYRPITRWWIMHDKKQRPNPNAKRDSARWRRLGYS